MILIYLVTNTLWIVWCSQDEIDKQLRCVFKTGTLQYLVFPTCRIIHSRSSEPRAGNVANTTVPLNPVTPGSEL